MSAEVLCLAGDCLVNGTLIDRLVSVVDCAYSTLSGVGPAGNGHIPGVGATPTDHAVVHATFRTTQRYDYNDLYQVSFRGIKVVDLILSSRMGRSPPTFVSIDFLLRLTDGGEACGWKKRPSLPILFHPTRTSPSPTQIPTDSPDLELFVGPFSFALMVCNALIFGMCITPLRYVVCSEPTPCKPYLRSLTRRC